MRMFDSIPRVVAINETMVGWLLATVTPRDPFGAGNRGLHLFNDVAKQNDSFFLSNRYEYCWRPLMRNAILGRLRAHADDVATERGIDRRLIVVKEPNGSHAAGILFSILRRSRLIFLLRDGRDVVDSSLDAALRPEWVTEVIPEYRPLRDEDRLEAVRYVAESWVLNTECVERAFDALGPAQARRIRYEDLRADTVGTLRPLLEWLGLDVDEQTLSAVVATHAFEALPATEKGSGKFARAATPGLWRENLSENEKEAMEEIMGEKLRKLGYG